MLATFIPRFVASANARITRSIELVNQRNPNALAPLARELHAIAGEAGLLGIHNIVALARSGEDQSRLLHASRSDADIDALLACLEELKRALAVVSHNQEGSHA